MGEIYERPGSGVSILTSLSDALERHENFDGSGYPYGLRGDDISIPARILSVAEFYDSAVSSRPHRTAFPPEEVLEMVLSGAGTQFDPEVTQIFEETTPPH